MVGRRGRPPHDSRGLPEVLYRPLVQTWFIRKVVLSLMLLRRQETVGVSQRRFLYFVENSSVWGLHHLGWALRKEKKEVGNCSFLRSLKKNSLSQTLEPGPSCYSVQVELFVYSTVGGCPLLVPHCSSAQNLVSLHVKLTGHRRLGISRTVEEILPWHQK